MDTQPTAQDEERLYMVVKERSMWIVASIFFMTGMVKWC